MIKKIVQLVKLNSAT